MRRIDVPLTIFLVGATGDLSKKKILKALYQLFIQKLLPPSFRIIGLARAEFSLSDFVQFVKAKVDPKIEAEWHEFSTHLLYISGDVNSFKTFEKIKKIHDSFDECGNHLWYIATLPTLYTKVVSGIKHANIANSPCGWTKILLEKPFGTNLETARTLNHSLSAVFDESQIYRIDHFLAKETVQNVLIFRFANGMFEHLWNNKFVDHVQITASETIGIQGRSEFYDATGAVRDVVQNHVLQMLATVLMDEPTAISADAIRLRRQELLEKLRPISTNPIDPDVLFAQYTDGECVGEKVTGYRSEPNIPDESITETAVALRCFIDTPRWKGVPIFLRAGKRLQAEATEISIQFKEPPNKMFSKMGMSEKANILTLRIQPKEGISLVLRVKKPGLAMAFEDKPLTFSFQNSFSADLIEAYVKLIYDAVVGDSTFFPNAEGIEASWIFIEQVLNYKKKNDTPLDFYPAGSWGPDSFNTLLSSPARKWVYSGDF